MNIALWFMPLLSGSIIKHKVNEVIKGRVARIGGSVDQLISYNKKQIIQDINIIDGGFGAVKRISEAKNLAELGRIGYKKMKQELSHFFGGSRYVLDRKTIRVDMHYVRQKSDLLHFFDASISSNVLEHSPNVIFLLLNFHLITKRDGWMYHAIPNYMYTYDRFRKPTRLPHFIEDFTDRKGFTDLTHNNDYIQSAIIKDGWQREFHTRYPVCYPFMHYHVFDSVSIEELFSYMFEDVICDVLLTDRFADNVVLCRNRLNENFIDKHKVLIEDVRSGNYIL
jgi:hypothetical protein